MGAAVSRPALRRFGIRGTLGTTQLATAAAYFALVNAPNLATAVVAAALIGVPGSILLVSVETHVQRTAPAEMLGRIGALFFAMDSLAAIAGGLGGPAVVTAIGLTPALNAISAFALLAVPVTVSAIPRAVSRSRASRPARRASAPRPRSAASRSARGSGAARRPR